MLQVDWRQLQARPFDLHGAKLLRDYNPHHSSCLEVLADLAVGLGFKEKDEDPDPSKRKPSTKVEDELDPICSGHGLHDLIYSTIDNQFELGAGYLEIRREEPRNDAPINGIHWIPAEMMFVISDKERRTHLNGWSASSFDIFGGEVEGTAALGDNSSDHAQFGRLEEFIEARELSGEEAKNVSEVIDFRSRRNGSIWYPKPRWLSATPSMELVQMALQNEFDHFYNRGIPEFILFLLGERVSPDTWSEIKGAMESMAGPGNQGKSLAFNVEGEDMEVQMEKLAMETKSGGESRFLQASGDGAHAIVSAHGVHPSLANITLAKTPGSANELLMATWFFQKVRLESIQRATIRRLAMTLGNKKCNGGLGLTQEDFFGFRTVMDDVDMLAMQGMSRMREPAAGGDRDPRDGILERGEDRSRRGMPSVNAS